MVRRRAVVLVAITVLVVGTVGWLLFGSISRSGQQPPAGPATTVPSGAPPAGPSAGPATPPTSPKPTSSIRPSSKPPSAQGPTTATAEGWRLAILAPDPGSASRRGLCASYEITGTSREPDLELGIALLPAGGGGVVASKRTAVPVGRGTALFDLRSSPEDRYDLRFRLRVDGRWIDGLAVTVANVRLTDHTLRSVCGPGA